MSILNFGSINIDYVYSVNHMVREGETIASNRLDVFCGGKGFNQSIAIARSGQEVFHSGNIGKDGEFMIDIMKKSGVNTDFINIDKKQRTGNAIIQRDKKGNNCIILYQGANFQISKERIDSILSNFDKDDYILLQNEINNIPYIIEKAYSRGLKIVFNPAPFDDEVLNYPMDKVDYIILNEIEAYGLINRKMESKFRHEDLLKILANKFNKSKILLTLGEKGSMYFDGESFINQEAYNVNTIDTTSAGDTYIGYFISGLVEGLTIKEAINQASAAAALAVSRMGAEPSIPKLRDVKKFVLNYINY